ncbi:Protein CBR-LIR-3 [Caenorhabditis briggsae]|uniref:C2H2-type domain-containing protein n=2 Tax=Caenorhabditis briggsae TaxID=6238 RepID=A0AAE9DJD9_CAEBR|nr:Protein CBR-LIR-3 [Caenorhabditis briggsae]ULU06047.1 hypothetical protein L3Y34_018151 [Caenorhabditis briggsae]CAP23661.1 Protein CBR-LIR-3 [Caenorhabditis briggsae]
MDPKFLVVEIDSKEQALQLVQIMLEKGFGRLMLLDELSKHPSVSKALNETKETAQKSAPEVQKSPTPEKNLNYSPPPQLSNEVVTSTVVKQEPPTEYEEEEEEEDMLLTSRHTNLKRPYNQEYNEQLLNMLSAEPELVPIGVNTTGEEPSGSNCDNPAKRKNIGEYHECRLCGVRVKTPRSGRWNLQMHVIALHCVGRQYRCKLCDYVDYRKSTMRKHTISQHGEDIPPHNMTDDTMRTEWHEAMMKCFPEFAHRTGFLS